MRVLYVTQATFAAPNAAALRNLGLAASLAISGHQVTIASPDAPDAELGDEWGASRHEGVSVVGASPAIPRSALHRRLRSGIGGSHGSPHRLLGDFAPDVVLLYQTYLPLLVRLRRAALRCGVPFVVDVTEWYDGAALPMGPYGPVNLMNQVAMRRVLPKLPAVVAISVPLAEHCAAGGARTLVVPPLFDLATVLDAHSRASAAPEHGGNAGRLRIAVTGSGIAPGHKDRLALLAVAQAARVVDPDGSRLAIMVAGPAAEQVRAELGGEVPAAFQLMGPLSWAESLRLVASCDFTMLLRDPGNRRAALGFPSKVPESLLLGTAIMGNPIGDLRRHLVDGRNAALVDPPSAKGLERTLRQLLAERLPSDRATISGYAQAVFTPEAQAAALDRLLGDVSRDEAARS